MDKFLTLLGLARRAGKLALGEAPVGEAIKKGEAQAVFLASDGAENTRRKLENRLGDRPFYSVPCNKAELGRALGRETCAVAAVTDRGLADSLLRVLAENTQRHDGGVTI